MADGPVPVATFGGHRLDGFARVAKERFGETIPVGVSGLVRKRRGPAPKPEGRMVGTHVRLSASDLARLRSEASALGTTVSALVRKRACQW